MPRGVLRVFALLAVLLFTVGACGKDDPTTTPTTTAAAGGGDKDCTGTPIDFAETGLPDDFPELGEAKFTVSRQDGPSTVVEGFYEADIMSAYNEYKEALEGAGYGILFDELEEHDSEISWKTPDEANTGQVALREQCQQSGVTYLKVTSRPAS
jgi:hypothetical protein